MVGGGTAWGPEGTGLPGWVQQELGMQRVSRWYFLAGRCFWSPAHPEQVEGAGRSWKHWARWEDQDSWVSFT